MKIVFITPASALRRLPPYRWGGKIYGQSNSITGPLILGGILKRACHDVSVYEELNASVPIKKLMKNTDVFCFSLMTSNAPRGYELADLIHEKTNARVIMGGMHPTVCTQEALQHADQVIVGVGKLFGKEYGARRFGLAVMARLGTFGANIASKIPYPSVYYRLRHFENGREPGEALSYPESFSFNTTG